MNVENVYFERNSRMKIPEYRSGNAGTYIFSLVCFFIGLGFITLIFLTLVQYDDRDESSGFSKLPDGRIGVTEFPIMVVGFGLMMCAIFLIREVMK